MKRFGLFPLAAALAAVSSNHALACAACFGKSDSPLAFGMNAGIMSLLAVIGSMLALIATFFVFINRRAARSPGAGPDQPSL